MKLFDESFNINTFSAIRLSLAINKRKLYRDRGAMRLNNGNNNNNSGNNTENAAAIVQQAGSAVQVSYSHTIPLDRRRRMTFYEYYMDSSYYANA